jgi:hypothetical protein
MPFYGERFLCGLFFYRLNVATTAIKTRWQKIKMPLIVSTAFEDYLVVYAYKRFLAHLHLHRVAFQPALQSHLKVIVTNWLGNIIIHPCVEISFLS